MGEIHIRVACAYRSIRQSGTAIWHFVAGLWLAIVLTVFTWFASSGYSRACTLSGQF